MLGFELTTSQAQSLYKDQWPRYGIKWSSLKFYRIEIWLEYDSRVISYDRRSFKRLGTLLPPLKNHFLAFKMFSLRLRTQSPVWPDVEIIVAYQIFSFKLHKSSYNSKKLQRAVFKNSPNSCLSFWLFLSENLLPRSYKNSPIWSLWQPRSNVRSTTHKVDDVVLLFSADGDRESNYVNNIQQRLLCTSHPSLSLLFYINIITVKISVFQRPSESRSENAANAIGKDWSFKVIGVFTTTARYCFWVGIWWSGGDNVINMVEMMHSVANLINILRS